MALDTSKTRLDFLRNSIPNQNRAVAFQWHLENSCHDFIPHLYGYRRSFGCGRGEKSSPVSG